MSWPLASFAIVALILGAGWLTYERSRPSARLAAVVGVLAAMAALGRDAFAALPDVKPITAMTLVVGYVLGPLPGFTVGALGMLASNFMLGQGPYTPWQMAAWGMVGLLGAGLAWVTRRRLGRVGLATACAISALAAKEVMNLYTWTLGASHTPAAFLAIAGAALAFDLTDAIASFLFGLAFAPELARVLGRVQLRTDIHWGAAEDPAPPEPAAGVLRSGVLPALVALVIAAGACLAALPGQSAHAQSPSTAAPAGPAVAGAARGLTPELAYLAHAQNPDGGFGASPGQESSELYTAWAALGLAAAGRDPTSVRRAGFSVLDSLRAQAGSLQGAGDLERTILALRACGVSVHAFPGGDPVSRLLAFRSSDGSFGHLANLTAFAILALRAAGDPRASPEVAAAADWLVRQRNSDGGFGFAARGGSSDVDDTAAALQALVAARGRRGAPAAAVRFLARSENPDGGFPQQRGGISNAQSSAWAVQALDAVGAEASKPSRGAARSPLAYLRSLLTPQGSIRYSRTGAQTPVWVTAQALTALAGRPLPIAPPQAHAAGNGAGHLVAGLGRGLQALERAMVALLGVVLRPAPA